MKKWAKKGLKLVIVWIISTIVIYLTLTIGRFINWCKVNEIPLFESEEARQTWILNLDPEKIQKKGEYVGSYQKILQEGLEESPYRDELENHSLTDGHTHVLGEFYDPLGLSMWAYLDRIVQDIVGTYRVISIFLGVSATIAYTVITSKKMKTILKIMLGYFCIMLIVPPLYMYSWTGRFWSLREMYLNFDSIRFYIIYTVIFLLLFLINYGVSKKMAEKLNEAIQNK